MAGERIVRLHQQPLTFVGQGQTKATLQPKVEVHPRRIVLLHDEPITQDPRLGRQLFAGRCCATKVAGDRRPMHPEVRRESRHTIARAVRRDDRLDLLAGQPLWSRIGNGRPDGQGRKTGMNYRDRGAEGV